MQTKVWSKERGFRALKDGISLESYRLKYPDAIEVKCPSLKTLQKYSFDSVVKALDGCKVAPDGTCRHGYPSWLLATGRI